MSSNNFKSGTPLFAHEDTHVWQNRIFGPFFVLSYLGWMVIFLLPGLAAGAASQKGVGVGIQGWAYFSNPWETWAYAVGEGKGATPRTALAPLVWSDLAVGIVSIFYFLLVLALAGWIITRVWVQKRW